MKKFITLCMLLSISAWAGLTSVQDDGGVLSVNLQTGDVTLITDDIAEGGSPANLWFTDARAKNACVENSITSGHTTIAPSGGAVFTALALKEALANKDTDGTLAANSDTKYASQKAAKTYIDAATTAAKLRVSAPTKIGVKAVMFSNLAAFSGITLPLIVNNHTINEGDRLLYDGETPGLPGVYTATGVYTFHASGTGTLTRAPDWAIGAVIEKGTLVHVGIGGIEDGQANTWLETLGDATVGSGDVLGSGFTLDNVTDFIGSSGTIKGFINAVSDTQVALTGVAPGTMVGGVAMSDGKTVFLDNETDPTQNGVYQYNESDQSFFRTFDWHKGSALPFGAMFFVAEGDYASKLIRLDGFTVGQSVGQEFPHNVVSEAIGYEPEDAANKSTDGTLAANSDQNYPSQKAVKTYADTKQISLGIANAPSAFMPLSTGSLTSLVANEIIGSGKTARAMTIENVVASAAGFSCVANPVMTLYDCGTSAGACTSGRTALASVTLTAASTITDGTVSSASLAAGHYWAWEIASGTCAALNATGSAEAGMQ